MSPVWRTNAGGSGRALILATVALSVPATSLFGSRANPRWLSLIWTNVNVAFLSGAAGRANARDEATPPVTLQITPVPTHAIQRSMPRRSIPSESGVKFLVVILRSSLLVAERSAGVGAGEPPREPDRRPC